MAEERKGFIERLKTRKTIILREPLLARLERKRRGSPEETEGSILSEEKGKSTYQLFVEKASRELAEAKEHLKRYSDSTECSWCRSKAEQLAKMTEQLEALTPLAEEFSEKVGALEAEHLQRIGEEITQIREWLEKAAGNPAPEPPKKKFVVRYLDNIGVEHIEEIDDDIAFYQRVRQEGLSVISIHKVKPEKKAHKSTIP